jgi:pimeloyl-ACP methyl ester carboxylesterase
MRLPAVISALALTAMAVTTPAADAAPAPPASGVNWVDCDDGFQCGTVDVPLDYARPAGAQLTLALIRLPAADPAHRIGSLLTNPGGPGASGVDFVRFAAASTFDPAVLARFDIIGIDNRGIARSAPVRCFDDTADQMGFWSGNPYFFPVGAAQERQTAVRARVYTRACGERNPALLPYLSTQNAARDLDRIRAAVGDRRTTYVGFSYGTYLGAVYANLFPQRVRAMVLSGVVDPVLQASASLAELAGAGAAAEDGLTALANACATAGPAGCPLAAPGRTGAAIRAGLDRLFRRLRVAPLPAPDADPPGEVTVQQAVDTTLVALYDQGNYPVLADALAHAETGDGSALLALARLAGVADPPTDTPYDNYPEAFHSYQCADGNLPRDQRVWPVAAAALDRVSPVFGRRWLYRGLACATWPARPARYTGPWNRRTAAPVLIVNGLHDPATSMAEARHLHAVLGRSALLAVDDLGHATFGNTSRCAAAAIDRYLLAGAVPAAGTTCRADHGPFDQPAAAGRTAPGGTGPPAAR